MRQRRTVKLNDLCLCGQVSKLDDPWFALDKLEHFLFCAVVVGVVYGVLVRFIGAGRAASLAAGVLLSLVAAGLKELGDYLQWWPGNLSLRDFVADLSGTAAASIVILAVHRPSTASSSTLAGLASSLKTTATATLAAPRRPVSYKALPAADIEMGTATED